MKTSLAARIVESLLEDKQVAPPQTYTMQGPVFPSVAQALAREGYQVYWNPQDSNEVSFLRTNAPRSVVTDLVRSSEPDENWMKYKAFNAVTTPEAFFSDSAGPKGSSWKSHPINLRGLSATGDDTISGDETTQA